eukprot:scaffold5428_cov111-Skeletonema_dohrnii-CCMP3373.AAC.1
MGSYGSTEVSAAGLWWLQPPFRSIPSPPPSPWLLFQSERSCESANKKEGQVEFKLTGLPVPL